MKPLKYPFNNFYDIVVHNAKTSPNKVVIFNEDGTKITNSEFKQKVDSFARFLEVCGVCQGDKVALVLSNSAEFVISIFAISKVGAVVVPINNFLKEVEIEYIVKDCGAKIIITETKYHKEIEHIKKGMPNTKVIWRDDYQHLDKNNFSFQEAIKSKTPNEDITLPKLDDLAVIIYTSGTTGHPKGAMLSFRNIFSNAITVGELFKTKPNDRFIVYLPMFHTLTFTAMIMIPIFSTASIIIVKSIFPFSNVLKQTLLKRATIFIGTPTIYNALNKAKIPWYFMWFNKLRLFISGSAPLSEQVLNDFNKKFKKAVMLEGYGLSECSPAVTVNRIDRQKPLSVGPALECCDIKIVDDDLIEVGVGEVGEVIVRGDNVMMGYLNKPEATRETIINGWLKTGDLGKIDKDGFLYIVDRKKDLIICKGINVYPREIEEVLYKFDGVDACAVIGIKDKKTADEDIVAFIQFKEEVEQKPHKSQIKSYLKKYLANYKIPKHIHYIDDLPKNATGKVLKRKLKEDIDNGKWVKEDKSIGLRA